MAIQRVTSKWEKTNVLLRNDALVEFIPVTRRLNRESLSSLLSQQSMVYVKPNQGTFGIGVIRVEKSAGDSGGYRFQEGTRIRHYASYDGLYDGLKQLIGNRNYLVQRGIHLLKHRGRRFDLRVMVQKSPADQWETTGVIGRLAHPGKIVTNYHSGGTPMSFEQLMSSYLSASEQKKYVSRLRQLGVNVARQLQTAYPRLKELGIDVAIDTDFKPWILEVNTMPDPFLFRKLKDKRIFHKIYRYAASYGRFKRSRRAASKR